MRKMGDLSPLLLQKRQVAAQSFPLFAHPVRSLEPASLSSIPLAAVDREQQPGSFPRYKYSLEHINLLPDAATLPSINSINSTDMRASAAAVQRVAMHPVAVQSASAVSSVPVAVGPEVPRQNNTGLPDTLKAGIETLSGRTMDDVRVYYHSPKPAQVRAFAYTQGNTIHVAPGQERHLFHEAWHVVQQKEGRVRPTRQLHGVNINDDAYLENEADKMGEKARYTKPAYISGMEAVQRQSAEGNALPAAGELSQAVLQRAINANAFFQKYEVTNEVWLPSHKETFSAGNPVGDTTLQPGIGVVATVPTHPDGKTIDQIGAIYVAGFGNREEAKQRFGLSVGLNAYGGLDKVQEAQTKVETLQQQASVPFFPRAIIAFTWAKRWENKLTEALVTNQTLVEELGEMSNTEKEKVRKRERENEKAEGTFVYGAIREAIIKAPATNQVRAELLKRPSVKIVYYHIGDDDAPSLSAPDSSQGGVYDVYNSEIADQQEQTGTVPVILAGGYRIRREDNPTDPGDIPAARTGTELAEFASDVDQSIRAAIAVVDPRIPYYSEANILVNSLSVDKNITQPDNPVSGEIFGKNTFESGNLKRFLKVYEYETYSKESKMATGFLPQASLITGTKGSGDRFIAYNFKKADKYPEITEDVVIAEYKKAIATSQSVGSPANLAINISLYFDKKNRLKVSAQTILKRFLSRAFQQLGGNQNPLYKALLGEAQTRKMQSGQPGVDMYFAAQQELVESFIDAVTDAALKAHRESYKKLYGVIKTYIDNNTKPSGNQASETTEGATSKRKVEESQESEDIEEASLAKESKKEGSFAQQTGDTFPGAEVIVDPTGTAILISAEDVNAEPPILPPTPIIVNGQQRTVTRVNLVEGSWAIFFA
jgi:hypothetical protein